MCVGFQLRKKFINIKRIKWILSRITLNHNKHNVLWCNRTFYGLTSFYVCIFLFGSQNRGLSILYKGRFSRSSSLGVHIGMPVTILLSVNFTTVSLSSLFGRTIPNWDLGLNWIGDVLIIVTLYLTWKVDISDTSSSGLYTVWFIQVLN